MLEHVNRVRSECAECGYWVQAVKMSTGQWVQSDSVGTGFVPITVPEEVVDPLAGERSADSRVHFAMRGHLKRHH
jgi:hypothetical protein